MLFGRTQIIFHPGPFSLLYQKILFQEILSQIILCKGMPMQENVNFDIIGACRKCLSVQVTKEYPVRPLTNSCNIHLIPMWFHHTPIPSGGKGMLSNIISLTISSDTGSTNDCNKAATLSIRYNIFLFKLYNLRRIVKKTTEKYFN